MANEKISAMPNASALGGTEQLAGVQSGANVKITPAQIKTYVAPPAAANPTATAGPSAINGSAATFMRSDGAPAIQKASSSQFGIVEVDGTTITAVGGVISAASSGITITDGTHTVAGSTKITFIGATVGGSTPDGTVTVSGGSSPYIAPNSGQPIFGNTGNGQFNSTVQASANSGGRGGAAYVSGGAGTTYGGDAYLRGGNASAGSGGGANVFGGNGVGAGGYGGSVTISAGLADTVAVGGSIVLEPGQGASGYGSIILRNVPTADPSISGAIYVDPVTHILHWK